MFYKIYKLTLVIFFFQIKIFIVRNWLKLCNSSTTFAIYYSVSVVFLSTFCSSTLIAFENDGLWLFQSVSTTHNTLRLPVQNRTVSWSHTFLSSTWKHDRKIPWLSVSEFIEISSVFAFHKIVNKQTNPIILIVIKRLTAVLSIVTASP